MRNRRAISVTTLVSLLLTFSLFAFSQTPPPKKKKIKNFGSSLSRIKWNAETNSAVDTGNKASESDDTDVIRIDTSLVTSDVLVVDSQGHPVEGLRAEDFQLTEDGEPQKVVHFVLGSSAKVPRSIVLIIDYSGSQLPYIKTSVEAAKTLVDKLNPQDRMAIVTDDVELILDFTDDKKKLKKKLDSLLDRVKGNLGFFGFGSGQQFGRSEQYSALYATLNEAFDESDQRPIIVFQTDGDEANRLRNPIIRPEVPPDLPPEQIPIVQRSIEARRQALAKYQREYSLEDIYHAAEKSRATVYTVIPGVCFIGLNADQQVEAARLSYEQSLAAFGGSSKQFTEMQRRRDEQFRTLSPTNLRFTAHRQLKVQSALAMVASLTGGWTEFLQEPSQAEQIYSRILADINQRYLIGYYPTNKEHDGKRRTIRLQVTAHPDYKVLGRKSYYAPGP